MTVVKSDNPIIAAILNGLFRSEVSLATVCTASASALTRLCRFMQMWSNPQDAGDFGVFKSVSWSFLCHCSQGGTGVTLNERWSSKRREGRRGRAKERGVMKFQNNLEEGDLMNGRTRVKEQLPGDNAVTNSSAGKGLRRERQENRWELPKHSGSLCYVSPL